MSYKYNYKLTISYIGTNYYGWQKQPKHKTIQQTIEDKLEVLVKNKVKLIASGRTDAGVHALGQVANFKTKEYFEAEKIKRYLNATLPKDIAIKDCKLVPLNFHARFSAKGKTYIYKIYKEPDPFMVNRGWYVSKDIDLVRLQDAIDIVLTADSLISMSQKGEYLRKDVDLREFNFKFDGFLLEFRVSASHFLRYMVRKLVAHVLHVGTGRLDINLFKQIIESKDPTRAMFLAPPDGLYLKEVYYLPEDETL